MHHVTPASPRDPTRLSARQIAEKLVGRQAQGSPAPTPGMTSGDPPASPLEGKPRDWTAMGEERAEGPRA